jgi:NodT family efflux transporter outer membrane factor (OMF) lipoprotein
MIQARHFSLVVALATGLSGCAVGPDFVRPPLDDGAGFGRNQKSQALDDQQSISLGRDIPADWWSLFQSPALDKLVRQAIDANPTLAAAKASLKAAHENTLATVGGYYPTLGAEANATRSRTPTSSLSPATADNSALYTLYTPQLTISYMLDIWGLNRRSVEQVQAQEDNQHYQLEAAYLTLTSSIVATAIEEASLRGQIDATHQIIGLVSESLDILHKQQSLGQIAEVDVLAQEAALAQIEQTLPPLENQLSIARNQITALIGQFPANQPDETFTLDSIHLPSDLPLSLPSRLVEQRPDILAAEAAMQATSAQVGIALANRLPNITLSGNIGSAATHLSGAAGLFTPGTGFWTLGGNMAATLFDGFTLEHRQRAAEYGLEQTAAQYKATVIAAFQNVSDSLNALSNDARALQATQRADRATNENLKVTRRQLELGAVSTLALLSAQQTQLQARVALVQAVALRLTDTVNLYQSLGGGWWNNTKGG